MGEIKFDGKMRLIFQILPMSPDLQSGRQQREVHQHYYFQHVG